MTVPMITFFNNKSGVGKTSLVYHLAWMYARQDRTVVAVDLDPQANLTAGFLDEDRIEQLWNQSEAGTTIYQALRPLTGTGDLVEPMLMRIADGLFLLPGDVGLSRFEDVLAGEWPNSMNERNLYRPMRILTSFWQVIRMAVDQVGADLVLIDIGPNLGAINRSVLIGTDHVIIPLGADLFSIQGLKNLGPMLNEWRRSWSKRIGNWRESEDCHDHGDLLLPAGKMAPIGYLCQQHGVRLDRPVKAYDKWIGRIPGVYRQAVMDEPACAITRPDDDPYYLGMIRHYRSLVPMAQESRKPIFELTAADGAIGGHAASVKQAGQDFQRLSQRIVDRIAGNSSNG